MLLPRLPTQPNERRMLTLDLDEKPGNPQATQRGADQDAQSVIDQMPGWFDHYNEVHPPRAWRYRSLRELIAQTREALSGL